MKLQDEVKDALKSHPRTDKDFLYAVRMRTGALVFKMEGDQWAVQRGHHWVRFSYEPGKSYAATSWRTSNWWTRLKAEINDLADEAPNPGLYKGLALLAILSFILIYLKK